MKQDQARVLPIHRSIELPRNFKNNLPVSLTSFVGREQELERISALLQRADIRLLTLAGPGGVGKTRLSLAVAARLLDTFSDGVFFIALASLNDPRLLLSHLAHMLGLNQASDRSPLDLLQEYLYHQHSLLVLDNLEHLSQEASVIVELLQTCPHLKVLVTSRAILRLQGEHVFEVSPFSLPKRPAKPLLHFPAVQLFVQRAQALKADFTLTQENGPLIAEICRQLDGLPLAIELAAARINLFPLRMLLSRLEHRLTFLTTGAKDVSWRQKTLRNTLQWSYDLLNQREQELLRILSVFANGCTLEAIVSVSGLAPDEVLDTLGSLVDESLVARREQVDGELRLVMLEMIREYGWECLQNSGEAEQSRQRHAAYFLALAEKAEPQLTSENQLIWLEQLEREHDNLRAALKWLIESGQHPLAQRLASALWAFWAMYNHMREGHRWFEQALADSQDIAPALRARVIYAAASLAHFQSDQARAADLCEEALALLREQGDKRALALVLNGLGHVALTQRRYTYVLQLSQENLALARELGDRWKTTEALFLSVYGYLAQRDYQQASAAAEASLVLCRELGQPRPFANVLQLAGYASFNNQDQRTASERYLESLDLALQVKDEWLVVLCLLGLGEVAAHERMFGLAAQFWGRQEALRESIVARRTGLVRDLSEKLKAAIQQQYGERAFRQAWDQGRGMTIEQLLEAWEKARNVKKSSQAQDQASSAEPHSQRTLYEVKRPAPAPQPFGQLTAREIEVLRLLAQGLTNAQIAAQLVVSPRTIDTHLTSIYGKIQVTTRSAAVRYALEHGLV